jgi:hypothetical protein
MAADSPSEQARVIAAYLDDVDLELDAAKRLIAEADRKFRWPLGARPADHPGLTELGL